ncbi:type II toxin-antitoxin system RelE/ParE family toxin [Marinomonas sp. 2405UD66-6]|uniref:type II toxin-antitoxin system RelE/ParE family toxin n=1 Tax=Marinomonas sp. 2405UD66-6 TaxID=3391834 RepID=UPI0039C9D4D6
MNVRFLKPAELELDDAFEYYQSLLGGLGYEFVDEIERSIERIKKFPTSYQEIGKYSRRCLVHRFPYGLIYQVRRNEILIVAVSHLHQKPESWKSREE